MRHRRPAWAPDDQSDGYYDSPDRPRRQLSPRFLRQSCLRELLGQIPGREGQAFASSRLPGPRQSRIYGELARRVHGEILLLREHEGELKCDIPLIIGNHKDLEQMARQFEKPFYHLPISNETKLDQEAAIKKLLAEYEIDLVVMARYMQILSEQFVQEFAGKVINIHHGFLPAFQGARPYHQAYERGVKIIGATAHYATAELDEGPIIEQDVERVMHDNSPEDLVMIGKDIERLVLARAVKAHIEHRIIISGRRTIVFSEGA